MDSVIKKKLLIYAHYYIPDIASTGQVLSELAEGLCEAFDVTVICVVPSYLGAIEEKYKTQKIYEESINGVRVIRIRVPEFTKTNKLSRVKNIVSYFFGAMKATDKVAATDYIFTISQPPILGGLLGVIGKKKKRAKLIYNIQDFNPEQIMAVSYSKSKIVTDILMVLDKYSCKKSDLIITVGRDLVTTLERRFCNGNMPKTVMINNWIDEKSIYPIKESTQKLQEIKQRYHLDGKFVIMYSGNIGLYYDLVNIIKVMGKFTREVRTPDGREVVFAFVGEGSVLEELKSYKESHGLNNIVFIPYQEKKDLIYSLNAADVHLCTNAKGIMGVSCPSKYYGIAAAGKAVLAILEEGSEIRCIIDEVKGGLCSNPEDYKALEENIDWFIQNANSQEVVDMGKRNRDNLLKNLTREISIQKYANEILKL